MVTFFVFDCIVGVKRMNKEIESKAFSASVVSSGVSATGEKRSSEGEEVHCYDARTLRECLKVLKSHKSSSLGDIDQKRMECVKMRSKIVGMQVQLDQMEARYAKLVQEERHVDTILEILTNLSMSNCEVSVCKTMTGGGKMAKPDVGKENGVIDLSLGDDDDDDDNDDNKDLFDSEDENKEEDWADFDQRLKFRVKSKFHHKFHGCGVYRSVDDDELEYVD